MTEAVAGLKAGSNGEIQIHGSGNLAQTLSQNGLIDEYRLWVAPVVLGRGKRLFAEGSGALGLTLVESRQTGAGVAVHRYMAAGKPEYGTFEVEDVGSVRKS